jgi:hypothetical protein
MSDQWETFCDVGYYHMWRLRRKPERGWHDGFHINTGEEAKGLCETLNKLERERDRLAKVCDQYSEDEILCKLHKVTEQRDRLADQIEANHKGTLMLERMVYQLREQRDRLAEALRMITTFDYSDLQCDNGHGARSVAVEALQSLTNPNEL